MCLIIAKNSGVKLPPIKYLKNAYSSNPDGIGIAYWKNKKHNVIIKKDFDNLAIFVKWLKKHIKKSDACIIHFRFATSGLIDEGNRHPFPLTKNGQIIRRSNFKCKFAVAHNGMLSQYSQYNAPQNKRMFSDTQQFVMDILYDPIIKKNLDNRVIKKLINEYISGDKLAFINFNGSIIKVGDFESHNGIHYSNDKYKIRVIREETTNVPPNDMKKIIKAWERTEESSALIEGKCEGCGKEKKVKYRQIYRTSALLCDGCYKKYNEDCENHEEKEKLCDSCQRLKPNDMVKWHDGQWICDACIVEFMGCK
jgi:predicted glutamine amidotransferase